MTARRGPDSERMLVPAFRGRGRIELTHKPIPRPGPGQLLLEVGANALCGSERGQFEHGSSVTPGHEAAGVVAAAGPGTSTPVGTPGVVYLMDFCGNCRSCLGGATNQCTAKRGDMGFNRDGGYAPYEVVSERIVFPVDQGIDLAEATMLLDIMGTGGHAIVRGLLIQPDVRSVAIAGAGPIGLGTLAMARLLLGRDLPVFISDYVGYRLALAERLGGTPVDVAETSLHNAVRSGLPEGADLGFDTTGKAEPRRSCLDAVGKRGALVCIGHGERLDLEVSADLIGPERAVLGSEYFRFDELPANLERLRAHRGYLSQIITHRFPREGIQEAFETFFRGDTGKVIIER